MPKKIFLGTDHAGFELKEEIKKFLTESGYEVEDCGAKELNNDDDYPDFVVPASQKAIENDGLAIILGGSGQGEAIAANKVKGVRAALFYGGDTNIIKLSKEHNDANVLSLGARFLSKDQAIEAVKLWLNTNFSNEERHKRRLDKISKL